jgi:hypothetical protein
VTFDAVTGSLDPDDYDVTVADASNVDNATGTLTVQPATASVELGDQATASSQLNAQTPTDAAVVAQNVSANFDAVVAVTVETAADELTVVGLETATASELDGSDRVVAVEDTSGFPGAHAVQVIQQDQSALAVGDTIAPGDSAIIQNATATIFQGSVSIDDKQEVGSVSTVTVSSDLQPEAASNYVIVVHEEAADGSIGPAIGTSSSLTGSQNVSIAVDERNQTGTQSVFAMLHFPDESGGPASAIPNADATAGFVAGNVVDSAAITVEQPPTRVGGGGGGGGGSLSSRA